MSNANEVNRELLEALNECISWDARLAKNPKVAAAKATAEAAQPARAVNLPKMAADLAASILLAARNQRPPDAVAVLKANAFLRAAEAAQPACAFNIGSRVHIDTDTVEWGRVASDGEVVSDEGAELLIQVDSIRANILVPLEDVHWPAHAAPAVNAHQLAVELGEETGK